MIKSVNNYPISQIFDIEAGVVYGVPRYQREYSWGRQQWENLFDDLLENDPGYFLGSMICINQSKDTLGIQKLELVDGQQRLMTLSLLFAAVYDILKNQEIKLDEDQKVELFNLKRKLVLKKKDDEIRLIPQIQNHNQDDYQAVLSEIGIISPHDIPAHAGNRKVFHAYRYFQNRVKYSNDDKENPPETILEFLDKVSRACLVKIEVASHADAYTLFESLNNRGMPLTAIDLIKNKLLARLETIEPGKIDYYFGHWNRLLGYLGEDYSIQERFFRQYYNAFKDDFKAIHQVPVATRTNMIQIYEKFIDHDARECLKKISSAAKIYALFLSRNGDDSPDILEKPFKELERIQGAPAYLLLLYLFDRKEKLKLTNNHFEKIIPFLVRFFVRRNLTDTPPTRDLTRLFMNIIAKVQALSEDDVVNTIYNMLLGISASDDAFRTRLEGAIYDENSWVARFVLCALAEQAMTKETWVDLWRTEKKKFIWTIEHIFPQGPNIPEPWVKMIAGGDEKKAKEIQQTHVHKLGNLTISVFNSALGNKSFGEKRDRTDRQGRSVGYKNGIKLNEDLAAADAWSVAQIEARTKKLVDHTMKLFQMDSI